MNKTALKSKGLRFCYGFSGPSRNGPLISVRLRPRAVATTLRTPKEFESRGFTLKTHQMFFVHTTREEFKNATKYWSFWICFLWKLGQGNHITIVMFQNVFLPRENEKPEFSNSSGLRSVFKRLRFRDGFVWTVDLTVEIKRTLNLQSQKFSK